MPMSNTILIDPKPQISNISLVDRFFILGIIIFLVNVIFVPYKDLHIIEVNSKNNLNDLGKNQIQKNTLNFGSNPNSPKLSKIPVLIIPKDKNDNDVKQKYLYADSLLVSNENSNVINST